MVKKKISPRFSFKGFNWRALVLGAKRPIIALIGAGLTTSVTFFSGYPEWAWLAASIGGLSAERIWSTLEFYINEK